MSIANVYRDRTINEITESDVGSTVKVAGWVENIRDHGGVSFIDLRDMYGVLQVVMRDTSLMDLFTIEGNNIYIKGADLYKASLITASNKTQWKKPMEEQVLFHMFIITLMSIMLIQTKQM